MNKGIYAIICKANGKMYIGYTTNFKTRKKTHWTKMSLNDYKGKNDQLQNDWNLYGKSNFKFVVIEEINTNSIDLLLQKEEDYIIRFGTFFEDKGYNISLPVSKKYRHNLIKEYGEDFLRDLVYSNDELLLKEDLVFKKKEMCKKVYQISIDNTVIRVWDNKYEIKKELSLSDNVLKNITLNSLISKNKKRKLFKNYVWVFEHNYSGDFDYSIYWKRKNKKEKPIKIYKNIKDYNIKRIPISLQNINNQEIKHFTSYKEAEKELGFKLRPLINGYKNKGGGKTAKITQWRGWKIYK